jgi:hypothetical protein
LRWRCRPTTCRYHHHGPVCRRCRPWGLPCFVTPRVKRGCAARVARGLRLGAPPAPRAFFGDWLRGCAGPLAGVRIGEASHPGPPPVFDPDAGDLTTASLRVIVATGEERRLGPCRRGSVGAWFWQLSGERRKQGPTRPTRLAALEAFLALMISSRCAMVTDCFCACFTCDHRILGSAEPVPNVSTIAGS